MKLANIERAEFATGLSQEILTKASTLLGYGRSTETSLLNILKKLDIQPLDRRSVHRYQKSKEKTGWYSGTKYMLLWVFVPLLVIAVSLISSQFYHQWKDADLINTTIIVAMLASGVCLIGVGIATLCDAPWGEGTRIMRTWNVVSLSGYQKYVPEFALSKAVQIKEACPQAYFGIEELAENTEFYERPRPDPDPFLTVTYGSEKYYIEVWDEKDYEAKL